MTKFTDWWQNIPKSQKLVWTVLCLTFIFFAGMDIGRALHQAIH
ncbi:hypothetical protein [Deinococcus alpinitundrae]|nr:hypothetical protein [Deinococcus alpinitundrae]